MDWFETTTEFGVVTEFAQGELFEILEEDKKMSEDQIRKIALQLAQALYYLHSNRIIHRDMKPQNILIGSGGVIKLCDFGFARAMSQSTVVLTSIKGTPLYMAPELVQDQPYNHSVDLWSFGIILYELFVGEPPFYTNKLTSLIQLIIKKTIKYPDNISTEFKDFLSQLLVKEPNRRLDWPDLLEHPFLQKTNVDLLVEQQLVERYVDWMAKLATWNPDFREFTNRISNVSKNELVPVSGRNETTHEDRIPLKEIIRNSKKETMSKNQKMALEMFENCLHEIILQITSSQGAELEESDFNDFCGLSDLILASFSEFSSFDKLTKEFSGILRNIGKNLFNSRVNLGQSVWFISQSVKFSQKSVDSVDCVNLFLTTFKTVLIANDLQAKEYLTLLNFLTAIQIKIGMRLDDHLNFLNHIRQQRLFEQIFNSRLTCSAFLSQAGIIEAISQVISPVCEDLITFPLLKQKNITSKKNRLDSTNLNALLEFNEYIQSSVFIILDKLKWLDYVNLDDVNFLKILIQFLRISEDCVKRVLSTEKLINSIQSSVSSFSHKSSDLQELFIQIYTEINKSKQTRIYVEHEQILDIFQKDESPFLIMLYFNFVSSLMDDPVYIKRLFVNNVQFSSELLHTFDSMRSFLEASGTVDWSKVISEDYVNSGFVLIGANDSIVKILRQILMIVRRSRELLIEFITKLSNKNIHTLLFSLYEKLDRDFMLSLKGLVNFLGLTVELLSVTKEHLLFVELLIKDQTIRSILMLLSEDKNRAVQEWPRKLSGSTSFLENTKVSVVKILDMLLGTIVKTNRPQLMNNFANQLKSCSNLLKETLSALEIMATQGEGSLKDNRQRRPVRMNFIVSLFKSPDLEKFATHEFMAANGIEFIAKNGGLSLDFDDELQQSILSDHLSILTQLSVESKECYPAIHSIGIYEGLTRILSNGSEALREKACRLVGHLCKHSDYFYEKLDQMNIIDVLAPMCKDGSAAIRRSVCLALGNAAFHSDCLYRKLSRMLPQILKMTSDKDERVRANAIGTINNLIRNSESLFGMMQELKVPQILKEVVLTDQSSV